MVRKAFSFIELVVAIVVMGIVFLTVPLILSETQRSSALAIQQEAVMAGMTQLVNTMSYRWDERQTDDTLNGGYAKVLDTKNGASAFQCINMNGSRWRRGHFRETDRRRCYNSERNATDATALGPDGGDLDDIDDIIMTNEELLVSASSAQELNASFEYKKNYEINLSIYYIDDNTGFDYNQTTVTGSIPTTTSAGLISTNIKMLSATIVSTEGEKVVLRSFLTNIGEYKIYHKTVAP